MYTPGVAARPLKNADRPMLNSLRNKLSGWPSIVVLGVCVFAVSFFGANVYPENVAVGLEQPTVSDHVTGKFVLETVEDSDRDRRLRVTVELAPGSTVDTASFTARTAAQFARPL